MAYVTYEKCMVLPFAIKRQFWQGMGNMWMSFMISWDLSTGDEKYIHYSSAEYGEMVIADWHE